MPEFEHPGIFVEEVPAGIHAIEGVSTGTAAFVGYTEKAAEPRSGRSLFGQPVRLTSLREYESMFGGSGGEGYDLHAALRLFFENGGMRAFLVSVGPFGPVDPAQLYTGLDALETESEHDILVAPDALRLPEEDYHSFVREMVERAAASRRRMAVVDVYGGGDAAAASEAGLAALLAKFRAAIAPLPAEARSFGAAYHPWLITDAGLVPPSAAVAGAIARNDIQRAVWKAPANLRLSAVSGVTFAISPTVQDGMNAPPEGCPVNAIRHFEGRGILVWGARTLEGGTAERKYVNLRRTLIHIEGSIEKALQPFVFEPNEPPTWSAITAMIENFLFTLWRQGALLGTKPDHAFFVRCGLGTTMTQSDLDAGRLIVVIGMALLKPAEFVIIRIGQMVGATL